MHKEIIVNSTPNEVRVALLEDHEVVEFSMERADNRRVVGNVFKGVVTAVRPGLQAAFVEIGMEKAGFLHVSDLIHDSPDDDDDRGGRGGRRRRRGREGMRPIETMLKEGDEILVQVTKEIIGTKGPRLTADISLPGRFMVLMPKGDHVGVSRKIEDRRERHRLRDLLTELKPDDEGGAFIIRTAAIGIERKMLERDMDYLRRMYKDIQDKAHSMPAPALVHQDVGLLVGMIRDIFKDDINRVETDSREDYQELLQYVKNFSPDLRDRIHLYEGDVPIFDKYGIEQELKKSLERKVWMKRGGFLVIDEAEALVAIDVNTGRYTGKKNQAETIFKTNMLAAKEIARQLRLRDVGGIIVLDFIDMDSEEDKRRVLAELRSHLKRDRARTKTFPVTELGLVEMSRQRVQQSLKDRLSDDCPYCRGAGQVLSTETLANKVENLLLKLAATRSEKAVQVRANPTLALMLMSERANSIQNIARATGIRIDVVDDPRLHREEFQIISTQRRKDLVAETERAAVGDARGAQQERRPSRGDSERRRRGRDEDRPSEEGDGRESRRGGRRGRRDDEAASSEREPRRDSRSRRRSDSSTEDRRSERDGEDSSRRTRVRRRRSDADAQAERQELENVVDEKLVEADEVAVDTAGAADSADDADSEDKPRRRRRRGRRGGRGRRRGRDEAGTVDSESGEASEDAEVSSARQGSRRRGDEESERPVRRRRSQDDEAPSDTETVEAEAADGRGESSERPVRRRIRRQVRRSEGSEARESADSGASDSERRSAPSRDSEDDRGSRDRRTSGRRRSRSTEDGPTPPPTTAPIAARDDYARPILEEEHVRRKAESESEAETALAERPRDEKAVRVEHDAEDAPAAESQDARNDRLRRRRRTRRVTSRAGSGGAKRSGPDDD